MVILLKDKKGLGSVAKVEAIDKETKQLSADSKTRLQIKAAFGIRHLKPSLFNNNTYVSGSSTRSFSLEPNMSHIFKMGN